MSDVKAGCIVKLLTGGPPMTVEKVEGDYAVCTWIDKEQVLWRDHLKKSLLKLWDPWDP